MLNNTFGHDLALGDHVELPAAPLLSQIGRVAPDTQVRQAAPKLPVVALPYSWIFFTTVAGLHPF